MAKFKRGNLDLNTNQKIRLGDSLESFFQFDGSNLIINTGVGDLSLVGNLILDGTSALTANTIEASDGFTVGGTVITDGQIADDGNLTIDTVGTVTFLDSAGATHAGVYIGKPAEQAGQLNLYGHASGSGGGGLLNLWTGEDYDTNIIAYQFGVQDDGFNFGPNTDGDAFQFVANVAAVTAVFNVDLDVNAALSATTVDADTDFTVGATVITDGIFTTSGTDWTFVGDSGTQMFIDDDNIEFPLGAVDIGVSDSQAGQLNLFGHGSGTAGGSLIIYLGVDADDPLQNYALVVYEDDLRIGTDVDPDMLQFLAGTSIQSTVAFDVDAACTATTFDADTDFTVGGTIITDDNLAMSGTNILTFDEGDVILTVAASATYNMVINQDDNSAAFNLGGVQMLRITSAGTLEVGNDSVTAGTIRAFGHATASTAGGKIQLDTAVDHKGDITSFDIAVVEDDLLIGPVTDPDAFKFIANGTAVTGQFTVDLDVDAALTINAKKVSAQATRYVFGDDTATDGDVVLADSTAASTITMTEATDAVITVKKLGVGDVIIQGATGLIDGIASKTLNTRWQSKTFICDGTDWFIIGEVG